jgi:hypothetical protein
LLHDQCASARFLAALPCSHLGEFTCEFMRVGGESIVVGNFQRWDSCTCGEDALLAHLCQCSSSLALCTRSSFAVLQWTALLLWRERVGCTVRWLLQGRRSPAVCSHACRTQLQMQGEAEMKKTRRRTLEQPHLCRPYLCACASMRTALPPTGATVVPVRRVRIRSSCGIPPRRSRAVRIIPAMDALVRAPLAR